ncbi:DUF5365 family protein [Siminovitchia sediminis]|uniref:DUF5365 family protein n=1 Tax=Siminovitchia sediminis TaxID=1274353 RepID=A0ABW4KJ54_9BACI
MKVVFAASLKQEEMIRELISHLYQSVFPLYFTEEEIRDMKRLSVLKTPETGVEWLNSAEDAFRIIAALQVLISMLETTSLPGERKDYQRMFIKNKHILEEHGISFPFTYTQFCLLHKEDLAYTMFATAANQYLL